MYKMKEVCQLTGLTEKTVRFYVDQKLLEPKTEPGLHYKSYRFDDADIQRLQDIAALRSAEFTIADIRQMLADPNSIPALVAEREGLLSSKIQAMRSVQTALQNLTVAEQTDFSQVADAIEPRSPQRTETPKNARNRLLWLAVYTALFLGLGWVRIQGTMVWILGYALALLGGINFPIMAVGYFRYNRRWRKLPRKAEAKVVSVVTDEGIQNDWDETFWDVFNGMMTLGFLHWNWVRPDHWVPLIQFDTEGGTVTTAYRYGGLKTSWHTGDTVSIAWDPEKPKQVYPCGDPVIRWKGICYLLAGAVLMAVFILTVICK